MLLPEATLNLSAYEHSISNEITGGSNIPKFLPRLLLVEIAATPRYASK